MTKHCKFGGFLWDVQLYGICLVAQLCCMCAGASAELVPLNIVGKPAWQSTTLPGYRASFAVDGDYDTFCHTTKDSPHPWWKVDLEDMHCLGSITVKLRRQCCDEDRFITAVARAGLNFNITENPACGSPATRAQSAPGSLNTFACDPPRIARYVSFDIDASNPLTTDHILMLAEVTVKELPYGSCPVPTIPAPIPVRSNTTLAHFKLLYKGAMIGNPTPLATRVAASVHRCAASCLKRSKCLSFDYAPGTKLCRLHDLNAQDADKIPSGDFMIYLPV